MIVEPCARIPSCKTLAVLPTLHLTSRCHLFASLAAAGYLTRHALSVTRSAARLLAGDHPRADST